MNKNLLEEILKKLKKKGCDEADIVFAEDSTISSSSRLGKIEKTEVSEVKEIGIRAIINKKQSIVSSTNIEEKNIDIGNDNSVSLKDIIFNYAASKNFGIHFTFTQDEFKKFNDVGFDSSSRRRTISAISKSQ